MMPDEADTMVDEPVIEAIGLVKHYRAGLGVGAAKGMRAVDGVSFSVRSGETLGITGASGCGKTTIARMISKLTPLTAGQILLGGRDIADYGYRDRLELRRRIQIIFQNPEASLNPRIRIRDSIAEVTRIHGLAPPRSTEEWQMITGLAEQVGLLDEHLARRPWELSGGQIQRAVLARVLALRPQVLVADEPTSMLDVSVQAQMLALLKQLQRETGFAMVFITHDLDVIACVCDEVAVMQVGRFIETGSAQDVLGNPQTDCTKELLRNAALV
jgi:ABC-type glutathione transport system ATPase component